MINSLIIKWISQNGMNKNPKNRNEISSDAPFIAKTSLKLPDYLFSDGAHEKTRASYNFWGGTPSDPRAVIVIYIVV